MRPYYDDGRCVIYHGDCREVLGRLGSGIAAACVTDPPYNVGIRYGSGTDDTRADYEEWCRGWFAEVRRVVNGPVAVTCGQANVGMWHRIEPPTWWLAWHKPAAMGRCVVGFNNWEPIALYGKPLTQTSDVVRAPIVVDRSADGHPCPKPTEWAAGQIAMLAPVGAVVLEPFVGAGATLIAAKNLGRRAIGIEIEERYCEIAAKRLSQEVLDLGAA